MKIFKNQDCKEKLRNLKSCGERIQYTFIRESDKNVKRILKLWTEKLITYIWVYRTDRKYASFSSSHETFKIIALY